MTRILIVDDKEENLYYLHALLTGHGCTVDTARHGAEALVKARQTPPELIISDLLMPVMDGYTLLRLWKADARLRSIPFIVYTATYTNPEDERLAFALGADAFILKPAEPEDFLARIREVQANARIAAPAAPKSPSGDEKELLKVYSETLIRKLEEKTLQLEESNRALQADIAVRKKSEETLRLLNSAVLQAKESILITDAQLDLPGPKIIFVNPAFTQMTGYTAEEAIGQTPRILQGPRTDPAVLRRLRGNLERGEVFEGETINYRKDGTAYHQEWQITPLHDTTGQTTHYVAIQRDVTEDKRAEAELRWKTAFLEAQVHSSIDGILVVDPEGQRIIQNARLNELWKIPPEIAANPNVAVQREFIVRRTRDPAQFTAKVAHLYAHPEEISHDEIRLLDGTVLDRYSSPVRDPSGRHFGRIWVFRDITERKRAEADLSHERNLLRMVFDLLPDYIYLKDTESRFVACNKRCAAGVGATDSAALIGKTDADYYPDALAARFRANELAVLAGTPRLDKEETFVRPDGTEMVLLTTKLPFRDGSGKIIGLVGHGRDITERKRSEERLSEQAALLDKAHDAILVRSLDHRIRYWNKSAERIYGWTATEALGRHANEILYRDETDFQRITAILFERGDWAGELSQFRKDGTQISVDASWTLVRDTQGRPASVLCINTDITNRKRLEEQLRQTQKLEAIGTLAGGIAHDFNNILAGILGYTELTRARIAGTNPAAEKYLSAVTEGGERAAGLVRQILAFSRQHEQQRRPIQLSHAVAEPLRLLRASIPSTIEFDVQFAPDLPAVLADATQVHQVVMNLCTNAGHAMRGRPGRLGVRLEKFTVDALAAGISRGLKPGAYVRLSISDAGCGMDEATKARIFEPFFTTKPPGEGTGLGLSVVHGIMQSHEGAITVYSQPGKGTVFHLYFPIATESPAVPVGEPEPVPHGQGERVLFVDDELPLALLGQKMLEEFGYTAEFATSPLEALARMRADPAAFDLVVTDLTMPGMLGTDLARELLTLRPGLPVILITGHTATLTEQGARELGLRALLLKPLALQSFGTVVHRTLHPSSHAPHLAH